MQQATRYSELNCDDQQSRSGAHEPLFAAGKISGRFCGPKRSYQNGFSLVEPHINPEGVHLWSLNASCPIDVLFLTEDARPPMRMNRHEYFEVLYLCSGSAVCHVENRIFPFEEGDLAVIGSTPCHSIECRTSTPSRFAALFFDPDLIRCEGSSDSVEYLSPFLFQDSEFPHVVPAKTGVPRQVLELMLGIRAELPAFSPRAYLAARTYLKMLLMLLVNQYSSYLRTTGIFQQQQRAAERLRPVFQYVRENCGSRIQVGDAARMCGMSESHFMTFFKRVTGLSFMKYLSQHRIERSQELLVKTDRSIADISVGVGFCDQSYFGAVFYKHVGITPATYRRRYQNMRLSDLNGIPTKKMGIHYTCLSAAGTKEPCVFASRHACKHA
jgi:AraC-like DNA-binding protein/mannose-6-phosphate isomerase-like protein (cupin superfamily)